MFFFISKLFVYSLSLIVTIYLFISITKDYTAHICLSEYKKSLNQEDQDIGYQEHLLRKSLSLYPSNADTIFELGKLYAYEIPIGQNSKDSDMSYAQSKEFFQEALMLKPTDARKRAEYAWQLGSNEEVNEAIGQFQVAINSEPTDAYLHMIYAMWCLNQVKDKVDITNTAKLVDNYRNEQKQNETLKSYDGRYTNGVSIASFLEISQMEWDKALSFEAPNSRHEYESLADLNLLSFELDKAIQNYKRAKNMHMLARCYIIKGAYKRAVNILVRIVNEDGKPSKASPIRTKKLLMDVTDNDPGNYQSFYWLGKLDTRLGNTEKAIEDFKTTVHLRPKHIDAHLNLAELYNQTGKIDLAIEEYEAILQHAPNHKEAAQLLSEAITLEYKDAELPETP